MFYCTFVNGNVTTVIRNHATERNCVRLLTDDNNYKKCCWSQPLFNVLAPKGAFFLVAQAFFLVRLELRTRPS